MTTTSHPAPARRHQGHHLHAAPLVVALALLGVAVVLCVRLGVTLWLVPAGMIGPDLSFLAAIGAPAPERPGVLPRRAVPVYNAAHRPSVPVAVALAGLVTSQPAVLVIGVMWAGHIAWDRGLGYRLRNADGTIA